MEAVGDWRQRLEETALRPLIHTGKGFYLVVGLLLLILGWGAYAYSLQIREGLIVTGLRDRIMWGFYISNFVFFIGISYGGVLSSAVLRVVRAGWRTPMTRIAEIVAVVALMVGALYPIIDLGRPDRILHIILYGRWQSPIIWDVLAINTYLVASLIYLFLPLIPDLALCRDRLGGRLPKWRQLLYRLAAIGWRGTPEQRRHLETAIGIMMIFIIPLAVMVHTVVAWIFGMTLREPWNSTIFGFFFVAGAVFSGIATLIIVMAILRKVYHLEEYITEKQFIYLGYLLAAFTFVMLYANLSEYLTTGYKMEEGQLFHFRQLFLGQFAGFFWGYIIGGLIVPALIVMLPWTRNIWGIVVAAALVVMAMWLERYYLVVASLRVPQMPYEPSIYAPTWVEGAIALGTLALFGLLIALFTKLVPSIAIWEVAESMEEERGKGLARHPMAAEPEGG